MNVARNEGAAFGAGIPRRPDAVEEKADPAARLGAADRARCGANGWALPEAFEFVRVIGTGSMGSVLLARDRNLGRLVAIKTLFTDCTLFLDRLRREAQLLAQLDHSSIVRVHGLDLRAGRIHLTMEYARGGNLALSKFEPVPLVRTLRGVVDALGHAHDSKIVHRDVKPENILLAEPSDRTRLGGHAILSDFGLACGREEGSACLRSPIVGTPLTMSPEQVRGESVSSPSDIFSLGVTFYRQLSGRWPFRGRSVHDVFDAIQTCAPASLRDDGVPRRLDAIVRRALEKDPVKRFACMAEFGEALDGFLRFRTLFSFRRNSRASGGGASPLRRIHPEDSL